MGHARSYNVYYQSIRKDKLNQIFHNTKQLLLRIELLTNTNEHIPRNGNSKERRKYEQNIVSWMEDSVASTCASCCKSFGLSRRKHHCRLHGSVICNQCSQFLSFSIARCIIDSNISSTSTTNSLAIQQLINLKSVTLSTIINDESNEDYLRICMSCAQCLHNYHHQMCFKNIPKDEIFHHYEKIVQAQNEYNHFHPTYLAIIDSLLSGDTKYQIVDAQRAYRQLNVHYDKIDSISKHIAALADKCLNINENDTTSKNRYATICRNIRTYSVQVLQNFSISTKRIPSEDDIKKAQDEKKRLDNERMTRTILTIPGINLNSLEISEKLEPFIQQYHQVTQFLEQAKSAGRDDEVRLLESNLKELAQAMSIIHQN
ncbi:unnamed protein product [Rotaria sp. Silwood2]|nr:unnamed protein product [Rotaria sp. Silwood2]CAF2883587.1 unnamed protein product [Rotaria sp. Silwood2]CAF3131660.1 unnamed protein product [Rotaria sp. Silwood2]CAF3276034.1 unnamed protein product [Rotaria sp. Silwood2]CAF4024643.1 unnamed protein product [Rotaria sp. Silwood2]